ncbi:DUF6896 domain-containing protein [Chitinophaga caseinilytica]|uniref:DUF6896 domain-containing protein n=1 Tax=Chitinophaga caseinilytica TaxID=2267521 RepID=UPI003C2F0A46
MNEAIKELVNKYINNIKDFHSVLCRVYHLPKPPTYNEAGRLFPRDGLLQIGDDTYSYRYHGSGCTLQKNDLIIDYDLDILNGFNVSITSWKFSRFVESYSTGTPALDTDNLEKYFVELAEEGFLVRLYQDRYVFLKDIE